MIVTQSLTLAAVGVLVGLGLALAFGRFAGNLLFQLSPRDPLSLAAAATLMLVVAVLAGFVPARRASRVDPVVALRAE
jgi:putative ABC transport system permease protein